MAPRMVATSNVIDISDRILRRTEKALVGMGTKFAGRMCHMPSPACMASPCGQVAWRGEPTHNAMAWPLAPPKPLSAASRELNACVFGTVRRLDQPTRDVDQDNKSSPGRQVGAIDMETLKLSRRSLAFGAALAGSQHDAVAEGVRTNGKGHAETASLSSTRRCSHCCRSRWTAGAQSRSS